MASVSGLSLKPRADIRQSLSLAFVDVHYAYPFMKKRRKKTYRTNIPTSSGLTTYKRIHPVTYVHFWAIPNYDCYQYKTKYTMGPGIYFLLKTNK